MDNQYINKKRNRIQTYSKYYYLKNKERIQQQNQSIVEFQNYYWSVYEKKEPKIKVVDEIIVKFD